MKETVNLISTAPSGTKVLPRVVLQDTSELAVNLQQIYLNEPVCSFKISWGDGSDIQTLKTDFFLEEVNNLNYYNILWDQKHTYNPSSESLIYATVCQVMVIYCSGEYAQFLIPVSIYSPSYFSRIGDLSLVTSNYLNAKESDVLYTFHTQHNDQIIELLSDETVNPLNKVSLADQDATTTTSDPFYYPVTTSAPVTTTTTTVAPIIPEDEFVPISLSGNGNDDTGYGRVEYDYDIMKFEVRESYIDLYNADSDNLAFQISKDSRGEDFPVTNISWNEAARFINWLNISEGRLPAYKISGGVNDPVLLHADNFSSTNKDDSLNKLRYNNNTNYDVGKPPIYFIPTEDEWYKAAYFDIGLSAYWDYSNGSDVAPTSTLSGYTPDTAVYDHDSTGSPAIVLSAGGASPNNIVGQGGNVREWIETTFSGDTTGYDQVRTVRGGSYYDGSVDLSSSTRLSATAASKFNNVGLRVVKYTPPPITTVSVTTTTTAPQPCSDCVYYECLTARSDWPLLSSTANKNLTANCEANGVVVPFDCETCECDIITETIPCPFSNCTGGDFYPEASCPEGYEFDCERCECINSCLDVEPCNPEGWCANPLSGEIPFILKKGTCDCICPTYNCTGNSKYPVINCTEVIGVTGYDFDCDTCSCQPLPPCLPSTKVSLNQPTITVTEPLIGTSVVSTDLRKTGTDFSVYTTLSVIGGTATKGVDYNDLIDGRIWHLPRGTSTLSVDLVEILNDTNFSEGDESIIIDLKTIQFTESAGDTFAEKCYPDLRFEPSAKQVIVTVEDATTTPPP